MRLRAQAAVEYLMILAVVIIIALVVVGVLGGFPTLTAGISEKESAAYWTSTDIGIARYVIAGDTKMVLRNNKNFAIQLKRVTVGGTATAADIDTTLQPGQTTDLVTVSAKSCVASSGTYTHNIIITYTDATYTTPYTFTGAKPLVGTCQA
ncbi:MAG: hypothetical protein V1835_05685 [Candidatus Micrarchaeota archaeon]